MHNTFYLRQGGYVFVMSVSKTLHKNIQTDVRAIFREGWQWANEQLIKFWWRSGSLSGYRDCFPGSSLLGDTARRCSARHVVAGIAIQLWPLAEVCTVPVLLVF